MSSFLTKDGLSYFYNKIKGIFANLNTTNIFKGRYQFITHHIVKGSTGTQSDAALVFKDSSENTSYDKGVYGTLLSRVLGDGTVQLSMYAHKNDTSDNINSYIGITYPIDGEPYATAPTPPNNATSKEIINAQWINNNVPKLNKSNSFSAYQIIKSNIPYYYLQNENFVKGENPSNSLYWGLVFSQAGTNTTDRIGGVTFGLGADGTSVISLRSYKNEKNSIDNNEVTVITNADGTGYATAPTPDADASGTEIITAEWLDDNLNDRLQDTTTAGSVGPSSNATPAMGGSFIVPQITVDAKGRVTAKNNRTITLPNADSAGVVSQKGTRTSIGDWTITGLTANKPLFIIYKGRTNDMTGVIIHRIQGTTTDNNSIIYGLGKLHIEGYDHYCGNSLILIPVASSVTLTLYRYDNENNGTYSFDLYAYQ